MAAIKRLSKVRLYDIISDKIVECGFDPFAPSYHVDAVELAGRVCHNLSIEVLDFETYSICGILYKSQYSTAIALNGRRSETGRNFDCMHELIHYWLHDNGTYYCGDTIFDNEQNRGAEWQANEGAAQFLMPYQNFLPRYIKLFEALTKKQPLERVYKQIVSIFADEYGVGQRVVEYRLQSLREDIGNFTKDRNTAAVFNIYG